jgi:sulfatase maturation enzyme AslB (radical SAM superfamily)
MIANFNPGEIVYSTCSISKTNVSTTFVDYENDAKLIAIRTAHSLNQIPPECAGCTQMEQNTENITTPKLKRLFIGVGDVCNLACIMCGPGASSRWKTELGIVQKLKKTSIWRNLDLSHIEFVLFGGGENFLNDEFYQIINALEFRKEHVELFVHLNGTVLPTLEFLDQLSGFKKVSFSISIDDCGDRFEYIRYHGKWDKVVDNLMWLREHCPENILLDISITVGLLNQFSYYKLEQWLAENFATDRFGRQIAIGVKPVQGPLSKEYVDERPSEVFSLLADMDARRGTNWKLTFPEIYQMYLNA